MSGGRFDYLQYRLHDVVSDIKDEIEKSGRKKTDQELRDHFWWSEEDLEKYPEYRYHHKYSDEIIKEFKTAVDIIQKAEIYMQRIDWLLSGDDGDETFLERLKKDLSKLKNEKDID